MAFTVNWRMALVFGAPMPLLAGFQNEKIRRCERQAEMTQRQYAVAGACAEETMAGIRTILGTQTIHRQFHEILKITKHKKV